MKKLLIYILLTAFISTAFFTPQSVKATDFAVDLDFYSQPNWTASAIDINDYQLEKIKDPCGPVYIPTLAKFKTVEKELKYCNYLVHQNGVHTYFKYENGKVLVYQTKKHDGQEMLLHKELTTKYINSSHVYSDVDSRIISFDKSKIKITIRDICLDMGYHKYCHMDPHNNSTGKFMDITKMNFDKYGPINHYIDPGLFNSNSDKTYYKKVSQQKWQDAVSYLEKSFGLYMPVDKIVLIDYLDPKGGQAAAGGFMVRSGFTSKIKKTDLKNFNKIEVHESVHLYLSSTPVKLNKFEEGLADYLQDEYDGVNKNLRCTKKGWKKGEWVNGKFVSTTKLIPYTDFTSSTQGPPQNFYTDGQCFWKYIANNYGGNNTVKKIVQSWGDARKVLPPSSTDKLLIKDIVNPIIKADVSGLAKQRYNYVE